MTSFMSFAEPIKKLLTRVVASHDTHAKWLNTLSYMENEGAKLMAACEHPTLVPEQMLKHAAEEFRHAYYLKSQISKVWPAGISDYSVSTLLGGYQSYHYMRRLNARVSRMIKQLGYTGLALKGAAYALVSYAIEVRAHVLYPAYQDLLLAEKSRVSVRSIILEEAEHLEEMTAAIEELADGKILAQKACQIEDELWQSLQRVLEA